MIDASDPPLCFSVEIHMGTRTRLLTQETDLREMIRCHITALLENFTTGPKPAVSVNFLNQK